MTKTDNHEFYTQEKGDQDWHILLNDTIEELDREVPIRDKESNLSDYEPKAEAMFVATDTGAIYSADGSSWYREDSVVSDFEAKDSITFPDGSTVTSPGSGSAVDFEEDGSQVVANASAANFIESGAATVTVSDDGDGTVTIEVSATDTNTERTNEEIQDVVGALVSGGSNVTATYDDAGDTLTIDGLTDEQLQDLVGAMAGSNLTYDDGNGLLNAADTTLSNEEVEDIVGALISAGSNTTVTYDDPGDTLTIDANDTNLTDEEVQDIIGGILDGTLYYDDVNNLIGVADNSLGTGKLSFDPATQTELNNHTSTTDAHHTKYTDEEAQDAVGTILSTDFSYDDAGNAIDLASNSVTVAGNSVPLGGSTAVNHADLSNIAADDHHTRYTDEEAQDSVGTILGSNFTYSDATPSINLASDTVTVAGRTVSLGGSTVINHADLSSINSDDHHTRYTAEEAQDDVGNILSSDFVYDDSIPSITLAENEFTVNSGTALTGGGTATLGGSLTLDVDQSALNFNNIGGTLAGVPIKGTGDTLTWALSPDDDLYLRNTTDSKEIQEIDQDTGDIQFHQLGNNPTLFAHDHTDLGNTIPNSGLTNSSVAVNAGTDLTGGGSVSLGGSVTLDFDASSVAPSQLGGGNPFDIGARDLASDGKTFWNNSGGPSNQGELIGRYNGPYVSVDTLAIPDSAADPSVNGQFKRNGTDVKVYSGGAVRNLSNIGSSGGAPTDASYITTQSETGLSNETVVDAYPFTLADLATPLSLSSLTDMNVSGTDLTDSGTVIWDATASAVPQSAQGGPAGSLSAHPLSSSDLATGSVTTNEIANGTILEEDLDSSVAIGGFRQVTTTSDYNAVSQDSVWADSSSSSVTVTLPSPDKSNHVRVVVEDDTNGVTLSDNAGEGIQTDGGAVSSISLQDGEVILVEANGTTWEIVSRIEKYLAAGTLGTLPSDGSTLSSTITAVANDTTTPISGVDVYPADGQSLSGEYPFHAEYSQIRDYTNGETDVFIRVEWDLDSGSSPPSGLDLVYEIHGENAVAAGSGATQLDIQDGGSDIGTADTLNAGSGVSASVSDGVATLTSSGGSGGLADGSVQTSAFTASANTHYPVDSNGGAFTATLPGSPSDRDKVELTMILGNNTVTVDGNGNDIESQLQDSIDSQYTTKVYEYFADTGEWVVVT